MKIRILLIDDASFIRDLIKRTLRKYLPQCEIIECADGRKAQSILSRQPVDLILSDWEMPGLSGEELLKWVRADEKLAHIPFVMITSLGGKEHIMRAVQAGVSDYLGKPFTGEELMQKVNKALIKSGKLNKTAAGSSAKGGPFSSLEILSGKADGMPGGGSLEALTGGAKPKEKEAPKLKGTALVLWGKIEFRCMIKAISVEEVLLVSKRGTEHPSVFAPVTVTLSPGNQASTVISDLNAYVHSISSVEKRPDAEFLNLALRFDNPNAEQRVLLSSFILENP